jgi:Tfp pilus assembly protein PilE
MSASGFTLIEVMVASLVLVAGLVMMAQFFASAATRLLDSEVRSVMHQVATQEMENIRALPYDDVGTTDGMPAGILQPSEQRTIGNTSLQITREVIYLQDASYSGPYPANYRRATVTVSSVNDTRVQPVLLTSNIAGGAQGGTLDVRISNVRGDAVPGVFLDVTNNHLIPSVNLSSSSLRTDTNGRMMIPGLTPDSTNSYFVAGSKGGYNPAQNRVGVVVVDGTPFTVVQLTVDLVSGMSLHVQDENGLPLALVQLQVTGPLAVAPWAYVQTVTTDPQGNASLANLQYSTSATPYIISLTTPHSPPMRLPTGEEMPSVDPSVVLQPGQIPVILDPGTNQQVNLVVPTAGWLHAC